MWAPVASIRGAHGVRLVGGQDCPSRRCRRARASGPASARSTPGNAGPSMATVDHHRRRHAAKSEARRQMSSSSNERAGIAPRQRVPRSDRPHNPAIFVDAPVLIDEDKTLRIKLDLRGRAQACLCAATSGRSCSLGLRGFLLNVMAWRSRNRQNRGFAANRSPVPAAPDGLAISDSVMSCVAATSPRNLSGMSLDPIGALGRHPGTAAHGCPFRATGRTHFTAVDRPRSRSESAAAPAAHATRNGPRSGAHEGRSTEVWSCRLASLCQPAAGITVSAIL